MSRWKSCRGLAALLVTLVVLSGCTAGMHQGRPMVGAAHPTKSPGEQQRDFDECMGQAQRMAGNPAAAGAESALKTGALGAGIGATTGVVAGAIGGRPGLGAAAGAAAGALFGALGGAFSESQRVDQYLNAQYAACMQARGYIVR